MLAAPLTAIGTIPCGARAIGLPSSPSTATKTSSTVNLLLTNSRRLTRLASNGDVDDLFSASAATGQGGPLVSMAATPVGEVTSRVRSGGHGQAQRDAEGKGPATRRRTTTRTGPLLSPHPTVQASTNEDDELVKAADED